MAYLSVEIDEIAPPRPQFVRYCCYRGCSSSARSGGGHCKQHHAEAVGRWRSRNRKEIKIKRRAADEEASEEERALHVARAKLSMYLKRGKLHRGHCIEPRCVSDDITAYIADPTAWRTPTWVCRDHRHAIVESMEQRERELRERDAYAFRREAALAAFDALPADVQAAIRERAARGPMGLTLSLESPLFLQRLVSEVERLS